MVYDDKKEINMSEIVNNLNNTKFHESSPPDSQSYPPFQTRMISTENPSISPYNLPVVPPPHTGTPVSNSVFQKEMQRRIRYENSVQAFSEIYNTPRGLCGTNKFGAERVVFPLELEACIYVKPDSLYSLKPFYRIKFKGHRSPLDIPEKEFSSPSKLVQALMLHFGQAFDFNQNKGKVQIGTQALLNRVAKENPQFNLLFYAGWTMNESTWEYTLANGTTHGRRTNFKIIKTFAPPEAVSAPAIPYSSVQLTAATQVADMMNVFTAQPLRNIVWNLVHVATLYSLLDGLGYRFPLGVCIRSDEALVQNAFSTLLTWFEDKTIVLSESPSDFITLATERKDQPLLIQDIAAQIGNSKMIEAAIQTGNISRKEKESYKLYALPVVLSNKDSHLSLSSSIMRLDIPLQELEPQAYQILVNQKPYFQDYLLHFNQFAQHNVDQLLLSLKTHSVNAFENPSIYSLSSECTIALSIMHAVEDFTKLYFSSLHASEALNNQLCSIFSAEAKNYLLPILTHISHSESNASIAELFASVATQKLQEGLFEMRKHGEINTYDPCPPDKQGIVFLYDGDLCFSKESFDAIVDSTGYGYYSVLGALKYVHAFSGKPLSTKTPQCKMPGHNPSTGQPNTHVYRFSKEFISLPANQATLMTTPVPKSPTECNICLHLGQSLDGLPMLWYGRDNSHLCISGRSGTGKSYFLKKMMAQLPAQNVRCIIFDTSGEYSGAVEVDNPREWSESKLDVIRMEGTQAQHLFFKALFPDDTRDKIIYRFIDVLNRKNNFGRNQIASLVNILEFGFEQNMLTNFEDLLQLIKMRPIHPAIENTIKRLNTILPYGTDDFNWQLNTPGITVLDFHSGRDDTSLETVIELLLSTICAMRMYANQKDYPPVVLVFDECQYFDWATNSHAYDIMVRGRKYGLSAWLSTQALSLIRNPEILEQADLRICFKPTEKEIPQVVKKLYLSNAKEREFYQTKFATLSRGQFICKINDKIWLSQGPAQ